MGHDHSKVKGASFGIGTWDFNSSRGRCRRADRNSSVSKSAAMSAALSTPMDRGKSFSDMKTSSWSDEYC